MEWRRIVDAGVAQAAQGPDGQPRHRGAVLLEDGLDGGVGLGTHDGITLLCPPAHSVPEGARYATFGRPNVLRHRANWLSRPRGELSTE
jgi:hypothetical protein